MRSKFPDLIFKEILEKRAEKILKSMRNGEERFEDLSLDRVTIFITHRCNLRCKYCNGPHLNKNISLVMRNKMLNRDFPLSLYKKLVKQWVKHGLKYIHFTGGEPTLHPQLPAFIKIASENGILTSLTTNGTTNVDLFRQLVDNGLYEIRISIDSFDPYTYESITGVLGSYAIVSKTIKELVKMRDEEGKNIYLILNTVSSDFNIDNIENTVKQISSLCPDDMKILISSENREEIFSKGKRDKVNKLLRILRDNGIDMELLKDKILHLFRKNSYGLTDYDSRYSMKRCYLPITERTLDANGIYPCSIYLRNYGEPIADPHDPYAKQQKDIINWVNKKQCPLDNICRKHCTNCTKQFNLFINKKLREEKMKKDSYNTLIKADRINESLKAETQRILSKIKKIRLRHLQPYILIKPEVQTYKEEIIYK